ncbi:hypothetical protein ES703_49402 [subsurface metagenome]
MRQRKEIEKDFNNAMPRRKDEFLSFQRERILSEILLDIRELLEKLTASWKKK